MPAPALKSFTDPGFVPRARESAVVGSLVRPLLPTDHERLLLLAFDDWNRLIVAEECGDGERFMARPTPQAIRRIFAPSPASQLLLAHNHPSGESRPSRPDIIFTRRLAAAIALVGMDIADHLIITAEGHFSFRAAGLL